MRYKHIPFQTRLNFNWLYYRFEQPNEPVMHVAARDTIKTKDDCIETILKDLLRIPITISNPIEILSFFKVVGVGAAAVVGLLGLGIGAYYTTPKAYNFFFKKEEKEFQRFQQKTYSSRGPT